MSKVPVDRMTVLGTVLTHRRDDDAVAENDATQ